MKVICWSLGLGSLLLLSTTFVQWRAAQAMRMENRQLEQSRAATILDRNDPPSNSDDSEKTRLSDENKQLLKLRNEVGELSQQLRQLNAIKAENQRLHQQLLQQTNAPGLPSSTEGYTTKAALVDAGSATPEATLQTYFWALRESNAARLLQLANPEELKGITSNNASPEAWQQLLQHLSSEMAHRFENFQDFKVINQESIPPNKVILKIQSSVGNRVMQMAFIQIGNEWKVEDPF